MQSEPMLRQLLCSKREVRDFNVGLLKVPVIQDDSNVMYDATLVDQYAVWIILSVLHFNFKVFLFARQSKQVKSSQVKIYAHMFYLHDQKSKVRSSLPALVLVDVLILLI